MDKIYNWGYYTSHCGDDYTDPKIWQPFFDAIADRIVADLNPKTVLDVGCATGYLVAALRDRDVEAYGFDISDSAILHVREDIRPFCTVHSLLKDERPPEFPGTFDLVTCIEVLEHLYEEEVDIAVQNLCRFSDSVLFSSSSEDIVEVTHVNVRQPEYWAKIFAKQNYYKNLYYDPYYITKQTAVFTKGEVNSVRLTENYEHALRLEKQKTAFLEDKTASLERDKSAAEMSLSNVLALMEEKEQRFAELDRETDYMNRTILYNGELLEKKTVEFSALREQLDRVTRDLGFAQQSFHAIATSQFWKVTKPLRLLLDFLKRRSHIEYIPTPHAPETPDKEERIAEFLQERSVGTSEISALRIAGSGKRLNLVTDGIDSGRLFGGVATSLILASLFCKLFDIPLRIITRRSDADSTNYYAILKSANIEAPADVSFFSDCDRTQVGAMMKLELGEEDIFLATSWWTAEAIRKTTIRTRFFYLIQEVEPFFYPYGVEHYHCSQVLENENIDFIVNSHYLFDYFREHSKNISDNGVYFEPAFPAALYTPDFSRRVGKRKLFFYARPNNPRNLYEYGLQILEECVNRGIIDTQKWDIFFAGQDTPVFRFENGYSTINLGQLSWEEYSRFLGTLDLGLSLMYTPHPSYPPFDIACSGGVVVTNACLNKVDFPACKNVIVSDLRMEKMISAVSDGIRLAEDMEQRKENYEKSTIQRSWDGAMADVLRFMGDCADV